mmetsp:Transcript_8457/g.21742  ORF Transcript_8457/g.21742 Transcript_8457/m.21742 type:complete len:571 (-) Transcript_8457:404-2116(-)
MLFSTRGSQRKKTGPSPARAAPKVSPFPTLLESSPRVGIEGGNSFKFEAHADKDAPTKDDSPKEPMEVPDTTPSYRVRNTFIDSEMSRSPSLEPFYQERDVHTCPSRHIGRLKGLFGDLDATASADQQRGVELAEESATATVAGTRGHGAAALAFAERHPQQSRDADGSAGCGFTSCCTSRAPSPVLRAVPLSARSDAADGTEQAPASRQQVMVQTIHQLTPAISTLHQLEPAILSALGERSTPSGRAVIRLDEQIGTGLAVAPPPRLGQSGGCGGGSDANGTVAALGVRELSTGPGAMPMYKSPASFVVGAATAPATQYHFSCPADAPARSVIAGVAGSGAAVVQLPLAAFPQHGTSSGAGAVMNTSASAFAQNTPSARTPCNLPGGLQDRNASFHTLGAQQFGFAALTTGGFATTIGLNVSAGRATPVTSTLAPSSQGIVATLPCSFGMHGQAGAQAAFEWQDRIANGYRSGEPADAPGGYMAKLISVPPSQPAPGSLELPSMGSANHVHGRCKPCAFVHNKGCDNGAFCQFCHLCEPGEKKRRHKEKLANRRKHKQGNSAKNSKGHA